jgi:inhibitor of KinA sporulation pathway (predicted exonuclease)
MRRKLLVIDLEATCWAKHEHQEGRMETIEIGAVLVDADEVDSGELDATREFQAFVRPTRTSELSEFCRTLTGIEQRDVDAAEPFAIAFPRFVQWIGDPLGVRFASWGDYDRKQLLRDCANQGVAYPFADDHFNVKKFWAKASGVKPGSMVDALERAGLALEGRHHRGLDDARNIWRLLRGVTRGDLSAIVGGRDGAR